MVERTTRAIADWIVQMRYKDLPASVIDAMEIFITDHFGCVLGGTVKDSSRVIREVATTFGPPDGPCTLVGHLMRTSAPLAALINGTTGHALELDDDHREGTQHTGVAVIPAAFAVAEQEGKGGCDFILAAALGYEIMIRLGEAHLGKSYLRGFHPTGTCGSIGAAVAVGKLLGFDAEQMTAAMGMGASQSAGLLTFRSNGAWNKRFHAGHAGMAGVLSGYLVSKGYRGPSECLFSPEGWLQAFAYNDEYDAERLLVRLGEKWDLLDNSIKVHACCRFAGPIVDAALEVVHREDLKPDQVAEVVVAMAKYPLTRSLTEPQERKYNPTSVVDAQFSAPFAAAVAIVKRRAFMEEYSETGIRDPEVLKLARRVRWEVDPEAERLWPTRYPCEVRIKRTDGTMISSRVEWPKGDPENPATPPELEQKFRALSEPVLGVPGANRALGILRSLRDLNDLRPLSSALT
jgi:2-methylcitrate dehydratase PrpD